MSFPCSTWASGGWAFQTLNKPIYKYNIFRKLIESCCTRAQETNKCISSFFRFTSCFNFCFVRLPQPRKTGLMHQTWEDLKGWKLSDTMFRFCCFPFFVPYVLKFPFNARIFLQLCNLVRCTVVYPTLCATPFAPTTLTVNADVRLQTNEIWNSYLGFCRSWSCWTDIT